MGGTDMVYAGSRTAKCGSDAENAALPLLFFMGDDAARVHFCPCAGCGDNRTYRDSCVRELSLAVLHLPDVFVQQSLCGNHLAAVDHAAAALRPE